MILWHSNRNNLHIEKFLHFQMYVRCFKVSSAKWRIFCAPTLIADCVKSLLFSGLLKKSSGRIVNLSSALAKVAMIKNIQHLNHYAGRLQQYPLTKLCNILYTIELASRLKGTTTTTYSVHPGFVMTQFLREVNSTIRWIIMMIPGQFAKVRKSWNSIIPRKHFIIPLLLSF